MYSMMPCAIVGTTSLCLFLIVTKASTNLRKMEKREIYSQKNGYVTRRTVNAVWTELRRKTKSSFPVGF